MRYYNIFYFFIFWCSVINAVPTIRVLFIGNSLIASNSLPARLIKIGDALNSVVRFTTEQVTPGGSTFRYHATTNSVARQKIAEGNWDFVIMQEQSDSWFLFESPFLKDYGVSNGPYFISYPQILRNDVINAGGKPVFMATWAYRDADNQKTVTDAYTNIANITETYCAPCGNALLKIQQEKGNDEIYTDDIHPTFTAQVSNKYVIYATLTGSSPVGLQVGFDVYNNTQIQIYAWETYLEYKESVQNSNILFSSHTPTLSPVPSPTLSPVPSPTSSPVPSPTSSPVPSPTSSHVPSPTSSPVPSSTSSPVPSSTSSPVPSSTSSPVPSSTSSPVPSPTPIVPTISLPNPPPSPPSPTTTTKIILGVSIGGGSLIFLAIYVFFL